MQIKAGDQIIVSGFVARDADFRLVGQKETPLCKFSVKAGERDLDGQREAIWRNCTCWFDLAYTAKKIRKGDLVLAAGRYKTRTYTGMDGDEKTASEIECDFIQVARPPERPNLDAEYEDSLPPEPKKQGDFEEVELPDDLPF